VLLQWRIVFDEGHVLRNSANQQWKAAAGLATDRRWVVTGTPVETQISEFHALLRVLKVGH
jgi:SNF2 family DNA or RNA helicase